MSGNLESRWLRPVALLIFALSGCSGLIYQSIWSQYLGLYLGHAAYAQSLVLAIFMGGMAIGAWWASWRSMTWRNLLKAYALIELIIGVAAALFHPIYLGVTGFAYDTAFPALSGGAMVQAFKWSSGALLILPQAILLGTTFPLMSNGLMRRLRSGDGAILGGLYFTNSIGAAAGALIATFVLLPAIGLPGAMRFGAVLNLIVAVAAYLLARAPETPQPPSATVGSAQERGGVTRVLLVAAFVTGATSFVYEIGWVRMLSLAFGSTVHAFELMLAAFIGGLACGGWWIRKRIDGYAHPIRVGGWVQLAMGMAALLSLLLYDRSFDWVAWFLQAISRSVSGYALYNIVTAAVSLLLMAPAAFFAGMTLPLFTYALLRNGGGEASVGRIYAANTIGAIVGVFAAVHFLVPVLGLKLAMCVGAAGDLVLGLALLRRTGPSERPSNAYFAALLASGVALGAVLMLASFDTLKMASGVYRSGSPKLSGSLTKMLYYRDGKTASIAVVAAANGQVSISTNGKVDAAIRMADDNGPSLDEITMVMTGALPLLHHPHPRTAAVIGFGSGLTTHTLLGDRRLERVDTIEIEPAMVEGAKLFGEHVDRAYKDPRSHIHIEDAKTYFAANRSRYDIIVAEPSNPWVSGVASLFSQEFYRFVPRHLQPGGLFVQWIQLYEINDELVASVMRALSGSFKDYRMYLSATNDLLIVASADAPIEDAHFELLNAPELSPLFDRVDIATPDDVMAHQLGDRRALEPLFDALTYRRTSDFLPFLALEAPRSRFLAVSAQATKMLLTSDLPYRSVLFGLPTPPADRIVNNPIFSFTGRVHAAANMAAALRDGPGSGVGASVEELAKAALVRGQIGSCDDKGNSEMLAVGALADMAGRTLPYLDADTAIKTWDEHAWISCSTHGAAVKTLLELIAATARNDWPIVQQRAVAALEDRSFPAPAETKDWLLRLAMLSAIANKDYPAVTDIERRLGKKLPGVGSSLLARSYLLSFADHRAREPAVSSTGAGRSNKD